MTITFEAHTGDLCQALAAVAPFAEEKIPSFSTVRLFVDAQNITVTATNGNAAGLAIASTLALSFTDEDGVHVDYADQPDIVEVDLLPAQCKAIVGLFKAGATTSDNEDEPGAELRVDVTDHEIIVTDASGLLEGQSLTLPRAATVDGAAGVLVSMDRRNATGHAPSKDAPPRIYGPSMALVIKAARIYGHHLVLEHQAPTTPGRSGSTLIRCGESFLALIVDASTDEDHTADRDRWAAAWDRRLPIARAAAVHATTPDDQPSLQAVPDPEEQTS